MYDFVIQISLVASLAVIVYLFARTLPKIEDQLQAAYKPDRFDRLLKKLPLEQADLVLQSTFEKVLRKVKITVLKVDNVINEYLNKIKQHNEMRDQRHNIREKMEHIAGENDSHQQR